MERVVDARPVGFCDLWCLSVVEAVAREDGFAVGVVDADDGGFDCGGDSGGGWLVSYLVVQWSFASLLTENLQVVLHLCEPRLHSVDAFPMSFGALQRGLPSQNRLLFVPKPLDLLLDSG
jgi:hypothetical protein